MGGGDSGSGIYLCNKSGVQHECFVRFSCIGCKKVTAKLDRADDKFAARSPIKLRELGALFAFKTEKGRMVVFVWYLTFILHMFLHVFSLRWCPKID